jgi:aromatic ring-opening dioxygenase LigB subunit
LTSGTPRSFVAVADDLEPSDCAELGAELAPSAARVSLIVMGDGTARLSEKGPGYLDERAAAYDETIASALRQADIHALRSLDPGLARELLVAGRAPWQVLAGGAAGRQWTSTATLSSPFGVAYHVAVWT